jgi:hypothetical protein
LTEIYNGSRFLDMRFTDETAAQNRKNQPTA